MTVKPLPVIGFDRYVPRRWLDTALAIAACEVDRSVLVSLLTQEIVGIEARSKTMIILNRMWLSPHPTLVEFATAGVATYSADKETNTLPLHWGVALASHPFFAAVADSIGRLLKLHGEFTALQINRRLKEQLGDRASILRATEAVLQTMVEWRVISEATGRKRNFVGGQPVAVKSKKRSMHILEAAARASGRSLDLNEASNLSFPFKLAPLVSADFDDHARLKLASTGNGTKVATKSP